MVMLNKNIGFSRYQLGRFTITALFDGYINTPLSDLTGIATSEAEKLYNIHTRHRPSRLTMTTFAVSNGETTILIDAGGTPALDPDLGLRKLNMLAAGIDPLRVSSVLLTHLHTDHYGSLIERDGAVAFPNAELIVPTDEIAFRLEPESARVLSEDEAVSFALARRAVAPYRQRTRTIREGDVMSGISAVPLPGHTPGHTGWRIESDSEVLLVFGDIVHFPMIQFGHPGVGLVYDVVSAQAVETRRIIFSEASRQKYLVGGMHLDFPALGHISMDSGNYVWRPIKNL